LLVTTGIALAATLLFGSVAALRGRRAGTTATLAGDVRAGRTSARAGSGALVAIEIALAAALGIMAMLTARSFAQLTAVDLGFVPDGVVVARVALPGTYATQDSQRAFYQRLVDRVRVLPGVTAAGIISARPLNGIGPATTVRDAGRPPDPNQQDPVADVRLVDGGTLEALGISLERGTTFDARDTTGPVRVLVSATLARALWPGRDAVGRTMALEIYGKTTATVAGVFRDVHLFDARTAPRPLAYLPAVRFPDAVRDLVVRVNGDPDAIVASVRTTVASMDTSLPLYAVSELTTLVNRSNARDRLTMVLLAGFGVVALLLAGAGVFGVFAGDTAARRKEIGIRLALGARQSEIVFLLLGRSIRRVIVGLAAGALIALLAGRAMESLLFGVSAGDPFSFTVVGLLVVAFAIGATVIPALQALRRSPLATLREG
jgi:putative ABC transport system permease protein